MVRAQNSFTIIPVRLGTRLVTNAQDSTSFEQLSLPFGTALNAESTGSTNRRFTTSDRSVTTGLDYAKNRHYDAQQGRFTQVDPIGMDAASANDPQSLNMYSYCGNDPINNIDPEGLFFGKLFKWIGKILKWIGIVALVVMTVIWLAPASSFIFKAALWIFSNVLLPLSQVPVLGAFVPLGSLGTPQWNPQSRGVFGNSWQGQGSNCPPDCQEQITLPPVSAGNIYANFSAWERTWRGISIGLDKGLTTVVGFADFISYGGSKKAGKEFARVLGGDAAAREWTKDNAEREGSWFHTGGEAAGLAWDVAMGGGLAAGRVGWTATFNVYRHGGFGFNILRMG